MFRVQMTTEIHPHDHEAFFTPVVAHHVSSVGITMIPSETTYDDSY